MHWYNYLACFFSGMFLANAVPHFVYGISGDRFPTPFANPPGKGLSSAMVNVLWGQLNIFIGYILLRAGRLPGAEELAWIAFFAGVVIISTIMSAHFAHKQAE